MYEIMWRSIIEPDRPQMSIWRIRIARWILEASGVPKGGVWGVHPPPPRNSEDIGGVLDRVSKKNRRLYFLLQFTVFSYGCNLLNKGFF